MENRRLFFGAMALAILVLSSGRSRAESSPPALLFQLPWQNGLVRLDAGGDERPVRGPGAVALGTSGEVFILDALASRIQVMDESGRLLRSIAIQGWVDSLAVADDGRMARLDGDHRIRMALWEPSVGLRSGRESEGRKWIDLIPGQRLRSARLASPCGGGLQVWSWRMP